MGSLRVWAPDGECEVSPIDLDINEGNRYRPVRKEYGLNDKVLVLPTGNMANKKVPGKKCWLTSYL